jgi:hypothetical protein
MPQLGLLTSACTQEVNMQQRNSRQIAPPSVRSTTGARRTAMRVLHGKSQGIVAVYEQDPTVAEAGKRTLVFESAVSCARLRDFPVEWQLLTDDALAALLRTLG